MTASVVTPSALDADSSVGTPPAVKLLMTPRLTQQRPPGTTKRTNAVPTGSCVNGSAPRSGPSGLTLTLPILGSYGGRLTSYWAVAALQRPHPSMLTSSVSSFLRRWPKSALPLTELSRRATPVYVLASRSVHSQQYLPTTSLTPYVGYLTSVRRLTQSRRTS